MASRLLRLFVLGLIRGAGVLSPRRALFWRLRPLLVFVPAMFDAPRDAVIVAIVAMPFVATGLRAEVHSGENVGMTILASLTLIILAPSASARWSRSKAVGRALGSRLRAELREPIRRAAVAGAGPAIIAVLAVAAAFSLAIGSQRVGFLVGFLPALGIVFATVFRLVFLVSRTPSGRSPVGSVPMYVLAIALLAAAGVEAQAVARLSMPVMAAMPAVLWRSCSRSAGCRV